MTRYEVIKSMPSTRFPRVQTATTLNSKHVAQRLARREDTLAQHPELQDLDPGFRV